MRTRTSITGATTNTAGSRATRFTTFKGTFAALSRGAITASGSPCTLFIAREKSLSAALLIKSIAKPSATPNAMARIDNSVAAKRVLNCALTSQTTSVIGSCRYARKPSGVSVNVRSHRAATCAECVTIRAAVFCSRQRSSSNDKTSFAVRGSRLPVGSSAKINCGL